MVKYFLDSILYSGACLQADVAMEWNDQGYDGMIGNFE